MIKTSHQAVEHATVAANRAEAAAQSIKARARTALLNRGLKAVASNQKHDPLNPFGRFDLVAFDGISDIMGLFGSSLHRVASQRDPEIFEELVEPLRDALTAKGYAVRFEIHDGRWQIYDAEQTRSGGKVWFSMRTAEHEDDLEPQTELRWPKRDW